MHLLFHIAVIMLLEIEERVPVVLYCTYYVTGD